MNTYLIMATCLTVFLGIAHSIIGEVLIFKHWRQGGASKAALGSKLPLRHKRILWSTWHLASVFGWGISAILFKFSLSQEAIPLEGYIKNTLAYTMMVGGVLVLAGTRGRHPGWLVLLVIAVLIWVS